jgi:hypothetical protein
MVSGSMPAASARRSTTKATPRVPEAVGGDVPVPVDAPEQPQPTLFSLRSDYAVPDCLAARVRRGGLRGDEAC